MRRKGPSPNPMPSPGILERNPEGTASGGNGADRWTTRHKMILDATTSDAHHPAARRRRAGGGAGAGPQQRTSLGAVISELARQALVAPAPVSDSEHRRSDHLNGLPLVPWKEQGAPVDRELVNSLREELA